jgi:hypothetical protein
MISKKEEAILIEVEMARNALDRLEGLVKGDDMQNIPAICRTCGLPEDLCECNETKELISEMEQHRKKTRYGTRYKQRQDWGPIMGYQGRIAVHKAIGEELFAAIAHKGDITIRNARSVMRRFTSGPKEYLSTLAYAHLRQLEQDGVIVHLGRHYYPE